MKRHETTERTTHPDWYYFSGLDHSVRLNGDGSVVDCVVEPQEVEYDEPTRVEGQPIRRKKTVQALAEKACHASIRDAVVHQRLHLEKKRVHHKPYLPGLDFSKAHDLLTLDHIPDEVKQDFYRWRDELGNGDLIEGIDEVAQANIDARTHDSDATTLIDNAAVLYYRENEVHRYPNIEVEGKDGSRLVRFDLARALTIDPHCIYHEFEQMIDRQGMLNATSLYVLDTLRAARALGEPGETLSPADIWFDHPKMRVAAARFSEEDPQYNNQCFMTAQKLIDYFQKELMEGGYSDFYPRYEHKNSDEHEERYQRVIRTLGEKGCHIYYNPSVNYLHDEYIDSYFLIESEDGKHSVDAISGAPTFSAVDDIAKALERMPTNEQIYNRHRMMQTEW